MTLEEYYELASDSPSGLRWKKSPPRSNKRGKPACAGIDMSSGYYRGTLFGKKYLAHRVVFYLHNGYIPEFVDHIDGDRLNNDPTNLREATRQINNHNRIGKGYGYHKASNKWVAYITLDGKSKHLGLFDDEDTAREAYVTAKKIMHPTAPQRCWS